MTIWAFSPVCWIFKLPLEKGLCKNQGSHQTMLVCERQGTTVKPQMIKEYKGQMYLYVVNKILIFNVVASSHHKNNCLKMQTEKK